MPVGRPLNTTSESKGVVTVQLPALLRQQLVDFAYAEQSTMTAIAIEAFEDFLLKNAHILSERHAHKQELIQMLHREERERQAREREQREYETKFARREDEP